MAAERFCFSAEQQLAFMRQALALSRCALPDCRPNPPVGCVLVRGDQVVAEGYTQLPGHHHAEAAALARMDGPLHDVAAFVTLEPCSFHGRTPSCAKTLVERQIGAVYVALVDPHVKNRGKGIAILRQAGIPVTVGVAGDEVAAFLTPYLLGDE